MKGKVLIFVVGLGLVLIGQGIVAAEEAQIAGEEVAAMEDMKEAMEAAPAEAVEAVAEVADETAVIEAGNKICPVGGEAIEEGKAVKVTHNGKSYNLCCAMCEGKFKADPDKYAAMADEEAMKAAGEAAPVAE